MKTIFFVFLLALFSSIYADDAWLMRNELMAEAPNVSQRVLETAANSGVLPDALLFEVLAANPASIRNRDFLARLVIKLVRTSGLCAGLQRSPHTAQTQKALFVNRSFCLYFA